MKSFNLENDDDIKLFHSYTPIPNEKFIINNNYYLTYEDTDDDRNNCIECAFFKEINCPNCITHNIHFKIVDK